LEHAARKQPAGSERQYPIFREVRRAFLEDALNTPELQRLLEQIDAGHVRVEHRPVESPSPFAHGLLVLEGYKGHEHQMGRDRRANLLRLHRKVLQEVLSEEELAQLLDARAIDELESKRLLRTPKYRARSADELAQALRDLGDLPARVDAVSGITADEPGPWLQALVRDRRVVAIQLPGVETDPVRLVPADLWRTWHDATARKKGGRLEVQLPRFKSVDGALTIDRFEPMPASKVIPERWRQRQEPNAARRALLARHLRRRGPVTLYELTEHTGLTAGQIETALDSLVADGEVARGVYRADKPRPQWVDRGNLAEIHRGTMRYLKRELSACAPHEVMDFLLRWQHLHPDTQVEGIDGLRRVIAQLQGYEVIQGVLEPEVLAGRVRDYRPEMLERLLSSGEVCWRRVHPTRIHRVMLTLCQRRDLEWLTAARPVELDGAEQADEDIPEQIGQVRDYLRDRSTAFFDDIESDTGLDAGTVERAIWHLAWCGEAHCDTYEALRPADFRATLSACYDLATTPRNIVDHSRGSLGWDMTTAKIVQRLRKLGLDPRLGRWSVTERLAADPPEPPDAAFVVQSWADQLLSRWGILSRQIVDTEVAAPTWADLLPELKRRELLGQVQRGDFIDAHRGEQYGLPEAVELLRSCRGRRPHEGGIGFLPGEPLIRLTNRDPADLYASSLDILREDGEPFERRQRAGNLTRTSVVQAGQVLVYADRQNVELPAEALHECFMRLQSDALGREQPLSFKRWNGYPVKVSPAAAVMQQAGLVLHRNGTMQVPPPRRTHVDRGGPAVSEPPERLLPYYCEPPPVSYGREWTLSQVDESRRPVLGEVLDRVAAEVDGRPWTPDWHAGGFRATCGRATVDVRPGRRWVQVSVMAPQMAPWRGHRIRVTEVEQVDDSFAERLTDLLDEAQRRVDG
jgi:ATP-dependent Lhr-like helicase